MLHDLEAADGWAELTEEEQTERIRAALDVQLQRDKAKDTRQDGKKSKKPMCKHADCNTFSLGREGIKGTPRIVDGGKLVCPMHRCGLHGGRSAGGSQCGVESGARDCKHLGCSKLNWSLADRKIENPIGAKPNVWCYCDPKCLAADAPRRALFSAIRTKLGQDDPDVQSKLKDLNDLHNKKDDNMPFDTALAQLNTILAADNVLQALQDALDAGPSGAGGA